jgi:hypothetical protein
MVLVLDPRDLRGIGEAGGLQRLEKVVVVVARFDPRNGPARGEVGDVVVMGRLVGNLPERRLPRVADGQ